MALAAVVVLAAGALGTGIVKLPGTSAAPTDSIESPLPIDNLATPAQGVLAVGDTSPVTTISLDSNGASTTVSASGQDWDGLKIDIPAGAWPGSTLQIAAEPITRSSFGKLVTPISPLYTISGAEGMAPTPVTLKIPVTIPEGSFAMGFFYDAASGRLEGMPLLAEDGTSVTVATEHFSSVFVSLVERALLPDVIDSGFRPGVDDWQFPNYGSYISDGGQCAGQALTEAWYYIERRMKGRGSPLHGLYDNNGYGATPTPSLWEDDSNGYRLANVAQAQYEAGVGVVTLDRFFRTWRGLGFDTLQYDAFRYAMAVTAEPQLVSLSDAQNESGHVMLVYRVDPSGLWVADPNFSGFAGRSSVRRLIPFDTKSGTFGSYSSGVNSKVIGLRDTEYVNFVYKAKTALVDWSVLADDWAVFDQGKIGIGMFPAYDLQALSGKDAKGDEVWVPLADGYKTANAKLTLRIRDNIGFDDTEMAVYPGTSSTPLGPPANQVSIDLKNGPNPMGILERGFVASEQDWAYVNFVRLNIILEPAATPAPTPGPTSQTGGRWVLASAVQQELAPPHVDNTETDTIDSSNGRFAVSESYQSPPEQAEGSVTWGPPPTSAAPGDTWTTNITVTATCSSDPSSFSRDSYISVSVDAKVSVSASWVDLESVGVGTYCGNGAQSKQCSVAFPAHTYRDDQIVIYVDLYVHGLGFVTWTYTYTWQP